MERTQIYLTEERRALAATLGLSGIMQARALAFEVVRRADVACCTWASP